MPGHEFTGVVTEAGPAVTRFAVGDPVAVGNIVDACGECALCRAGLGVGPGTRVAVAGLGGLGHLAVKLAVALGADTSVVSRSPDKADDARRLGARRLIVSTDPEQMADARDRFDVVIDTVSAPHDLGPYLRLVAMDGTLSHLGHLGPLTVETTDLLVGRKKLSSPTSAERPPTSFDGTTDACPAAVRSGTRRRGPLPTARRCGRAVR
ncbi:hypothetical protein GCM10010383_37740 [Streptomyces lomondensis]|uniref:alcohol dehydrogenase (NADP(+)) n=1 Tax=Streptomyces lomondensis TaxID=68229 RepID=A0ABQ2X8A2_9ACTN|nr:hypothetical protein GCM10010383_37740 [Streptomyces lomondensis]